MNAGQNKRGTVFVAIILLLIVITIILSIARHFWLDSANEHFDGLIAISHPGRPRRAQGTPDRVRNLHQNAQVGQGLIHRRRRSLQKNDNSPRPCADAKRRTEPIHNGNYDKPLTTPRRNQQPKTCPPTPLPPTFHSGKSVNSETGSVITPAS